MQSSVTPLEFYELEKAHLNQKGNFSARRSAKEL